VSTTTYTISSLALRDGARLHYCASGNGAAVIFLHGWGASGAFFQPQMALSAQGLRLIVPDQRGHGASQDADHPLTIAMLAADLHELIVHLQLSSFSLVGWSMGAMVAWEYLRTHGTAGLEKLSVIDMTAKILTDDDWQHGLAGGCTAALIEQTADSVRQNWQRHAKMSAARLFARGASPDPALLKKFTEIMRANAAQGLAQLWLDMARQDYRALLPGLGEKCQYIYGSESRLYNADTFAALARLTGTGAVVGIANAGHVPQWEQPEAFTAALIGHLTAS
jgi:non-heme chloroperoxidase